MLRDQLKSAIRRKRRGFSSYGACLQHDNVRPHAAIHTVKQIQDLNLEALSRQPYAPGLSPIDFHLIWPLKTSCPIMSDHVRSDEVKDVVPDCLAYRPKDFFYFRGIYALMKRRRRAACRNGEVHFEDKCHRTVYVFAINHFM